MNRKPNFLLGLICILLTARATAGASCEISADLVFVIDISSSITPTNYANHIRPFLTEMIYAFNGSIDSGAMRTSLVRYWSSVDYEYDLSTFSNSADTIGLIQNTTCCQSGTWIGNALTQTRSVALSTLRGARPAVQDIVILFTDGFSNDVVSIPASALHNDGALVFAVGVAGYDQTQLKAIASDPDEQFLIASNFSSLSGLVAQALTGLLCEAIYPSEAPAATFSALMIVGVVVGAVAAVLGATMAVCLCWLGCCRRRKQDQKGEEADLDLERKGGRSKAMGPSRKAE